MEENKKKAAPLGVWKMQLVLAGLAAIITIPLRLYRLIWNVLGDALEAYSEAEKGGKAQRVLRLIAEFADFVLDVVSYIPIRCLMIIDEIIGIDKLKTPKLDTHDLRILQGAFNEATEAANKQWPDKGITISLCSLFTTGDKNYVNFFDPHGYFLAEVEIDDLDCRPKLPLKRECGKPKFYLGLAGIKAA